MRWMVLAAAAVILAPVGAEARSSYTRGYVTNRGTYVAPSYRTTPDRSRFNNYSSQGNSNPYTGRSGSVNPTTPRYR